MQAQSVKPTLAGTQIGAVFMNTVNNLVCEKSDGTEVIIVSGTGVALGLTATGPGSIIITSGGSLLQVIPTTSNQILAVTSSGANPTFIVSSFAAQGIKGTYGSTGVGGNSSVGIGSLPFSSPTSYTLVACFAGDTAATESCVVKQDSGSSVTVYNNDNLSQTINWIAIGL